MLNITKLLIAFANVIGFILHLITLDSESKIDTIYPHFKANYLHVIHLNRVGFKCRLNGFKSQMN